MVGALVSWRELAATLGLPSQAAVARRVARRQLLALRVRGTGGRQVFPAWQLEPGVIESLPALLDVCAYSRVEPSSGWAIAIWFTTPNADLGSERPLERLRRGDLDSEFAASM